MPHRHTKTNQQQDYAVWWTTPCVFYLHTPNVMFCVEQKKTKQKKKKEEQKTVHVFDCIFVFLCWFVAVVVVVFHRNALSSGWAGDVGIKDISHWSA